MADTNRNAIQSHTGNGSTTSFAVGFDYLRQRHIMVLLNGALQTNPTHYTVDSTGLNIEFVTAPITGDVIQIVRVTDRIGTVVMPVVNNAGLHNTYVDGSPVSAEQLNDSFKQCIYLAEEVDDLIRSIIAASNSTFADAQAAVDPTYTDGT